MGLHLQPRGWGWGLGDFSLGPEGVALDPIAYGCPRSLTVCLNNTCPFECSYSLSYCQQSRFRIYRVKKNNSALNFQIDIAWVICLFFCLIVVRRLIKLSNLCCLGYLSFILFDSSTKTITNVPIINLNLVITLLKEYSLTFLLSTNYSC